jgi:hypothetical protein
MFEMGHSGRLGRLSVTSAIPPKNGHQQTSPVGPVRAMSRNGLHEGSALGKYRRERFIVDGNGSSSIESRTPHDVALRGRLFVNPNRKIKLADKSGRILTAHRTSVS